MKKGLYLSTVVVMIVIVLGIYMPRTEEVDIFAGDFGIQLLVADHLVRYNDIRFDGEISSIDNGGEYILHNSPIGYYLYGLLYLLGGKTIEGYLAAYFVLSIVQALFLFAFGFFVLGPPGGMVLLALSLFSRGAVMFAGFPSQMTNAVFVESVAIGVFGLYVRTRRTVWFWVACLLSILATQLYPPMYLLIIPKVVLFFYYVRRIPLSPTNVLTAGVLGLYIYFPLILQEYIYRWDNLIVLKSFLSLPGSTLALAEIIKRFGINIHTLFSSLSWYSSLYTLWFVIGVVFLGAVLYRKKLITARFIFILSMLLVPAAILALHPSQPYVVPNRAYLMVTFPYVWLFMGSLVSLFPRRVVYIMTFLFIAISIWGNTASRPGNSTSISIPPKSLVFSIVEDLKTRQVDADAIDLFVISPDDSRSWDAGLYWYELEQVIGKRFSRIAYESSKARRISEAPAQTIYLICHRIKPEDVERKCKSVFEQQRMENYYGKLYRLIDSGQVVNHSYFVYQL